MSNELTDIQQKILSFIGCYWAENGYSPGYREITDGVGLSAHSAVWRQVQHLIDIGHIDNPKRGVYRVSNGES